MTTGILLIGCMLFICGLILLSYQGAFAGRQKEINRLGTQIAEIRRQNALLETQIAEASDSAVICYAASQNLNMIPAESAEAIHLVAVDTRPRNNGRQEYQPVVETLPFAQPSHVPVTASN